MAFPRLESKEKMSWTYDSLWQKTQEYVKKAMDEDRDGPLFPFWSTLALELLARATLAKIHPALLADPQGDNILYAFGYGTVKNPKSIPSKTLLIRCQAVVPEMTDEDIKFCMSMVERRNEELHSGSSAFDDLPTHLWLAKYFRVCKMLLAFQGHELVDLFGGEETVAAEKMIAAAEHKIVAKVRKLVEEARRNFQMLDKSVREEKSAEGETLAQREIYSNRERTSKLVDCPSCRAKAFLSGEKISEREPKLIEGSLYTERVILPTKFHCFSCDLFIEGHENLHAVELGGQFTLWDEHDPFQYYLDKVNLADYIYDEDSWKDDWK